MNYLKLLLYPMLVMLISVSSSISANESDTSSMNSREYIFLNNDLEGSQRVFNPLTVIINGSYDIYQIGYGGPSLYRSENNPFTFDYASSFKNVIGNLFHPIDSIKKFGVKEFITTQVFPTSLDIKNAQFVPNYQLHIIGGGITYCSLEEWYSKKGFSHYKILATVNAFSYYMLNEVMENCKVRTVNVDPIADMWIFNPIGILLFQSETVKNFFGKTLRGRDWSTMPYFNFASGRLENASQNYSFKIPLPKTDNLRIFVYSGMFNIYGLSYTTKYGYDISAGLGGSVGEIVETESATGEDKRTAQFDFDGGIFLDRDGSLLISVVSSLGRGERLKINIFPNSYMSDHFNGGLFFGIDHDSNPTLGIAFSPVFLGLGI